jgi:hypothetical protein
MIMVTVHLSLEVSLVSLSTKGTTWHSGPD